MGGLGLKSLDRDTKEIPLRDSVEGKGEMVPKRLRVCVAQGR